MLLLAINLKSFRSFIFVINIIIIFRIKSVKNQCPDVNPPEGGYSQRDCVGASNGQSCEFTCYRGCIPNPPLMFTCQGNVWTPPIPQRYATCLSDCPPLGSITNGNTCGTMRAGGTCTFVCNQGFQISGKTTFECRINITLNSCVSYWESSALPVCTQIGCSTDLIRPINGYLDPNCPQTVSTNQQCRVLCNPGYTSVANPQVVCTPSGWSPSVSPQFCQQNRCPDLISNDNNLVFVDINQCRNAMPNSRCQFSCANGYTPSPNINYLECNSNGQWTGQLPTCASVCYPVITQPTNGYTTGNCQNPGVGQECLIYCNTGFTLYPNTPRIQCTSNGWSPPVVPVCQQIRCPDLIVSESLIILDNQCSYATPGTRCQFNCPNGYYPEPNINYLDCNSNGQWSGQLPRCQQTQCQSVRNPDNGKLSGDCTRDRTGLNSVCTLYCFENCFLNGITLPMDLRCIGQTSNGGWDRQIPEQCLRPQSCDSTTIQFGSSCPVTPIGGQCNVNCLSGYRQSGSNVLTCVENVQAHLNEICLRPIWSPSPTQPFCIQVICPDIPTPGGSQGRCINAAVDDVCTWNCGPGYRNPINNGQQMTARCQSNGQWDRPTQCVQVNCPPLQRPVNGFYTDATCNPGVPGQFCQFTCFDRFTLDPATLSSLLCQEDGTWTNGGYIPRCVPLPDCINVPDPLFGKKSGHCVTTPDNRVMVGSVCNILCFEGCYLDDGTNTLDLNCANINGLTQWDKPIPGQCRQQTQCLPFGPIQDGSSCGLANIGDVCTLTCNEGFILVGNDVFSCILPSNTNPDTCSVPRWSLPPESDQLLPVCQQQQAIQCPDLSGTVIENGGITVDDSCASRIVGSVCNFFCNQNYVLNGEQSVQCEANGEWNNVVPTCDQGIINCPGLPEIADGVQSGECNPGRSGEKCIYSCNEGFTLVGEAELVCQHDTTWDITQIPSCAPTVCPAIEIRYAQGGCPESRPSETCSVSCDNGEAFVLTCTDTGQWDQEANCPAPPDEVNCEDLVAPENGNMDGDCAPGVAPEVCTFSCSDGFELSGEAELTCGEDGQWSAQPPTCTPQASVGCEGPTPQDTINMEGTCNPGQPEQSCTLSCISNPAQMKTFVCQTDGQWSDSFDTFVCGGPPGCPPVRLPNGAKVIRYCSPGKVGRRCEMGCGKGYKIDGKSSMLCTMNGKWIGKTARCLRQCKPINGLNGRLSGQCSPTGVQNRYCALRCNSGFVRVGPRTTLCGSNGLWTPTVPRCLRVLSDCG